ncbi:MAG: AraC family transcriptional regulator [Rhodospirillaceae bacterium]|nr:MAG: AraC family transcriptional regulator [Rhodospirillaceae bacterium]
MDCEIDLSSPRSEDGLSDQSPPDQSAHNSSSVDDGAGAPWPVADMASRPVGIDCLRQKIDALISRYDQYLTDAPTSLAALIFTRHRQDLASLGASIAEKTAGPADALKFAVWPSIPENTPSWQTAEIFTARLEQILSLHRKVATLVGHHGCGKPATDGDYGWAALALTAELANRLGATMQLHIWSLNQLIADTRARADAFPFASEARLRECDILADSCAGRQAEPDKNEADKNTGKGGLSAWQLRRIDLLVDAEPGKQIGVPRLAETVGLSVSHFTRAFKVSRGQPPAHWLLSKRLDLAKTLLVASDMSLAQIAEACGFAEQSHFSKRFRQMAGITPGDWRRRHK